MSSGIDPISLFSAFFMHVGARNIQFDFTEAQKKLFNLPATRLLVLFAMFYISTRSLLWSVALVLSYFLLVHMLLNETHPLNVLPRPWLRTEGFHQKVIDPRDMYQENMRLLRNL